MPTGENVWMDLSKRLFFVGSLVLSVEKVTASIVLFSISACFIIFHLIIHRQPNMSMFEMAIKLFIHKID